ncbi:hypothetical protein, conserved [Eimeria acervulina]|uniref:Uncharacterized protein n=1 Tax=Eimeria acervulina TaxID=5801 RepID=U6GWA8_EIMAC|nr:hypothetical protein, conserved [Eimeria acervulina]CDI84485.1 hypothetical protein, conserved [Eimeria acervulina]
MISGKGFSAYKVFVTWGNRRLEFYVCGLDPDSGGVSKEVSSSSSSSPSSSSSSSFSCLSAVSAAKVLQPDIVMVGLGYLDREKMFETFSVEKLLRCRQPEAVEVVIKRDNGQFIPLMQFLILKNIQYYLVGRDRLVEMGALGRELLWRPGEIYYLFFSLLKSKKQKENKLTPSLNRVLAEEGSRFTTLKIHQLLLQWFSQDKTADTPEPEHEFREQTFINKWAIGRSERECALLLRAQQLEKTKPPLSDALREKKNMKILLVCDVAMQRRLAERLQTELNGCLRGNKEPLYKEMMQLQDTSSTRFHLCLMIYFILPVATLCRFLWKRAKKAYLQYAVVGTTVTVGGDEVLSRLRSGVEEETEEGNKEKPNAKDKLEIVESRWLGFKHVVRDTSRD